MIFNSVDLKDYIRIKNIYGRWMTESELNLISIPGMDGAHFAGKTDPPKVIEIEFEIKGADRKNIYEKIDKLNSIFHVTEPSPFTLPGEDKTYYGVPQSSSEGKEYIFKKSGSISIVCPDPKKYGKTIDKPISTIETINNEGTAPAKPIIELTVKEDTTFALIENENDLMPVDDEEFMPKYTLLGQPYDVDDHLYEKYERVFRTNGETLVGWADASDSDIDGGVISGKMTTKGSRFVVDDYGTGSAWHGPGKKRNFDEPIQDFRLSAYVGFLNKADPAMVGRLEIYLRDVNGKAVAKMALKDTSAARANVFAEMRAGDRDHNDFIYEGDGNSPGVWNNFSGRLEITRIGNIWSSWIGVRNPDGTYKSRKINSEWADPDEDHMRPVTSVTIHMATVGDHKPVHEDSGISSIILDKINQEPEGVPYIAKKGDIIEFDMETESVYVNGIDYEGEVTMGSLPFSLLPGKNTFVAHPDIFDCRIKYKNTYR